MLPLPIIYHVTFSKSHPLSGLRILICKLDGRSDNFWEFSELWHYMILYIFLKWLQSYDSMGPTVYKIKPKCLSIVCKLSPRSLSPWSNYNFTLIVSGVFLVTQSLVFSPSGITSATWTPATLCISSSLSLSFITTHSTGQRRDIQQMCLLS